MIDPGRCRGCDRRLGVVGNAEAGRLDHAEIVGAIADHQRVDVVEVKGFGELDQRRKLDGAAQDRFGHLAGELAVLDFELVGAVLLKADDRCYRAREQREAAGDQASVGAIGAHRRNQLAATWRGLDALFQHFIDHADRHVLE